jgi:hypothetical protein
VVAVALAWTLRHAPIADVRRGFSRVSPSAVAVALVGVTATLCTAALRSRTLLVAYGAPRPMRFSALFRLQIVGLFYNYFLPGNVGGDLLRAHAMRESFLRADRGESTHEVLDVHGVTAGMTLVLVERVFGLAGLLTFAGTIVVVHPLPGLPQLSWLGALGVVAAIAAAVGPLVARRLTFLPGAIGAFFSGFPAVVRPVALAAAFALSIVNHALIAVAGWALLSSIVPSVPFLDAAALIPLASIAVYFPALAGVGLYQPAFAKLFGLVGVAYGDAIAAAFAVTGTQLAIAAVGGVVSLFVREVTARDFLPEGDATSTP